MTGLREIQQDRPENHPRVNNEDDQGAAEHHEAADGEVVHGHGEQVVHEVHVLREAVQDPFWCCAMYVCVRSNKKTDQSN